MQRQFSMSDPPLTERPPADSVERTLAQVGDSWTFLLLREAYFGVRRFDDFKKNVGAAPSVLTDRLRKLVTHGLFDRLCYSERPPRYEYRLTEKGLDLYPAIVLLMQWGDRWLDDGRGPPIRLIHRPCGCVTRPVLSCEHCAQPVRAREMGWCSG